jgi:hypothetical protein
MLSIHVSQVKCIANKSILEEPRVTGPCVISMNKKKTWSNFLVGIQRFGGTG